MPPSTELPAPTEAAAVRPPAVGPSFRSVPSGERPLMWVTPFRQTVLSETAGPSPSPEEPGEAESRAEAVAGAVPGS